MDINALDFDMTDSHEDSENTNVRVTDLSGRLIQSALAAYEMLDYREALRLCDEILDINQSVSVIWKFKGQCLYYLQRYSEAIKMFDSGLKLGGQGTEEIFFWKIITLYRNVQYITARKIIEEYLSSPSYLRTEKMTKQANEVKRKVDYELRGLRIFRYIFKKIK